MAEDLSYQGGLYRKQGGDEMVAGSSGVITIESSGLLSEKSGGQIQRYVATGTTATNLANSGHHRLSATTATGINRYILAPPDRTGLTVTLACLDANSSDAVEVLTSAATIGGSTSNLITFTAANTGLHLVSGSTLKWDPMGPNGTTVTVNVAFGDT